MDLKNTYKEDSIHRNWESVYRNNPLQDAFNDRIMARLQAYLKLSDGATCLDAGCGTGEHTARLARSGARCIGVDISEGVLDQARSRIAAAGLEAGVSFQVERLEGLSFPDATFDIVHCRGVLMHIPDWESALRELCRVLKPGGRLVLLESNRAAAEVQIVRLVRRLSRRRSRQVETPAGLEFWSSRDGNPFLVRIASIPHLQQFLTSMGLTVERRLATEFWDINRFPAGLIRNSAILFNRAWFTLRLPAWPSVGNALIARK